MRVMQPGEKWRYPPSFMRGGLIEPLGSNEPPGRQPGLLFCCRLLVSAPSAAPGTCSGWPGVMAAVPGEFSIPIPIRMGHPPA